MANNPVIDFRQLDDDLYWDAVKGDFELIASDVQHISDILISRPGDWLNSPSTGANIKSKLKTKQSAQSIESTVKLALEADGYTLTRPVVRREKTGKVIIDLSNSNAIRL